MINEAVALVILADFEYERGVFTEPEGHDITPLEFEAIDYLCDEWDYGYCPRQEVDSE